MELHCPTNYYNCLVELGPSSSQVHFKQWQKHDSGMHGFKEGGRILCGQSFLSSLMQFAAKPDMPHSPPRPTAFTLLRNNGKTEEQTRYEKMLKLRIAMRSWHA